MILNAFCKTLWKEGITEESWYEVKLKSSLYWSAISLKQEIVISVEPFEPTIKGWNWMICSSKRWSPSSSPKCQLFDFPPLQYVSCSHFALFCDQTLEVKTVYQSRYTVSLRNFYQWNPFEGKWIYHGEYTCALINVQVFLEEIDFLKAFQSEFRPRHSAELALVELYLLREVDQVNVTLLILFDFSSAFDTIDHGTLLDKLLGLGLGDLALTWLQSWLSSQDGAIWGGCFVPMDFLLYSATGVNHFANL